MPAGRAHLRDQLDRAATSIVSRMAKRSATEAAAVLDILERRQAVFVDKLAVARDPLRQVVAMLVGLCR